ncbi:hypothetical protein J7K27_07770 [Candidatus Bathyarchaeota archaeon]|nr:hypothetical protein [Candidatus Bathyarchaeota archaeon]
MPKENEREHEKRLSDKELNKNPSDNASTTGDSITVVHLVGSPRKSVSFKCNEKLWKTFVSWCKARGWTVCHFMEAIIKAVMSAEVYFSRTIRLVNINNLLVDRVVKRVRRYAVEDVKEPVWIYCVLKDRSYGLDEVKLLECYHKLSCPNVHCWERIKRLILRLKGDSDE